MKKLRKKTRKGEGGFTLVELMLAAGIVLTAIVFAMGSLMSMSNTTKSSADKAASRMNLSSITEEIRDMTLNELVEFQAANQGGLGATESITLSCRLTNGNMVDIPLTEENLTVDDFPNPLETHITVTWTDSNSRVQTQEAVVMVRRP